MSTDATTPAETEAPVLIRLAHEAGRVAGHVGAVARRTPDVLDAARSLAKLALPRIVRAKVVAGIEKVQLAVLTAQETADKTAKEEG